MFSSILIIILILLIAHLILLPVLKKRPILIKGLEGALFLSFFVASIVSLFHPFLYLLALLTGAMLYFSKTWILYGVSIENIIDALDRATQASRSTFSRFDQYYEIGGTMLVQIDNLVGKLSIIRYNGGNSRKSNLTKEIFGKFILNYFVRR